MSDCIGLWKYGCLNICVYGHRCSCTCMEALMYRSVKTPLHETTLLITTFVDNNIECKYNTQHCCSRMAIITFPHVVNFLVSSSSVLINTCVN